MQFDYSNIDLLDFVIRDADFFVKDLPSDKDNFVLKLTRPNWDKANRIRRFWLKTTKVPAIHSIMEIHNLKSIQYNWRDDAFSDEQDQHSIMEIDYDKGKNVVRLDTAYLEILLSLAENFRLSIIDEEDKEESNMLNIHGWPKLDFEDWKKEYEQRKTFHNNT